MTKNMLLAILFIIVGLIAIGEPMVAGLAVALLVGWALILASIAHLFGAFTAGGFGHAVWQVLIAIAYFIGGMCFVTHPLLGLGTLTLFLAIVLFVEVVFELVVYTQTRHLPGAGWRLMNAIVTAILGLLIWAGWPSTSVWAIGTLVGVNFLMTGFSRLMFGVAVRRLTS
jgi:uncharacterized membrane protein HdeD (DUF308 family)